MLFPMMLLPSLSHLTLSRVSLFHVSFEDCALLNTLLYLLSLVQDHLLYLPLCFCPLFLVIHQKESLIPENSILIFRLNWFSSHSVSNSAVLCCFLQNLLPSLHCKPFQEGECMICSSIFLVPIPEAGEKKSVNATPFVWEVFIHSVHIQ